MPKLVCKDYGFECEFVASGTAEDVVDSFQVHTEEEHGICYPKEAVMQFVLRKHGA